LRELTGQTVEVGSNCQEFSSSGAGSTGSWIPPQ